MNVHSLRIFDQDGLITYSTVSKDELLSEAFTTPSVKAAILSAGMPIFDMDAGISYWKAFFLFRLEPGTLYLRTTFPMRIETRLTSGALLGVLEFTQDITTDMEAVIRFQWSIIGITLLSSLLLFLLLILFLRRAEYALAVRMAEEQRLLRELHQHEKLAGMGRVVAGIAHEIRNPLGIIRSSAELLLHRQGGDPGNTKILKAIFDESRRLSQTVSDFLDYAKPKAPVENPVDLARVAHDVTAFLEAELSHHGIESALDFPDNDAPFTVTGDKGLLYRAFYNILTNSIQALNGPGLLRIRAERVEENGQLRLTLLFDDNGPGFLQEDRERLLDPFFTTKDGGTGLGLPIVHNIITAHRGTLTLEDAPGGGARVRISLPAPATLPTT
jgi:signal transduction histidine kinase